MSYVTVKRADGAGTVVLARARWCSNYLCKLRGLTFRRSVRTEDALVLVEASDNRITAGITMLFAFCSIAAIWVNSAGEIVDSRLAKPFRPFYLPRAAARYTIEGPPALLEALRPGDRVRFDPAAP